MRSICGLIIVINLLLYTDRIRPICLPTDKSIRSRKFVGDTPFIAGYGDTKESGSPAQVLMQLQVPVVDNQICKKQILQAGGTYADYQIKDSIICTDAFDSRRIWSGDSGKSEPEIHKVRARKSYSDNLTLRKGMNNIRKSRRFSLIIP